MVGGGIGIGGLKMCMVDDVVLETYWVFVMIEQCCFVRGNSRIHQVTVCHLISLPKKGASFVDEGGRQAAKFWQLPHSFSYKFQKA